MNSQLCADRVLTTRRDIFTSCSCYVYFEVNRKPPQSDKYSGHIYSCPRLHPKTNDVPFSLPVSSMVEHASFCPVAYISCGLKINEEFTSGL